MSNPFFIAAMSNSSPSNDNEHMRQMTNQSPEHDSIDLSYENQACRSHLEIPSSPSSLDKHSFGDPVDFASTLDELKEDMEITLKQFKFVQSELNHYYSVCMQQRILLKQNEKTLSNCLKILSDLSSFDN